ncbi:MAG TPA: hypothetical protein VL049_30525 [Candidatus Dormibacteraeota bacterium]|nr:hypothetical protein [Candidatus Dormibacteraeota bacterium]
MRRQRPVGAGQDQLRQQLQARLGSARLSGEPWLSQACAMRR